MLLKDMEEKVASYLFLRMKGFSNRVAYFKAGLGRNARRADEFGNDPEILQALAAQVNIRLTHEIPKSILALSKIRDNSEVSAAVRVRCAETLLNRAGVVEKKTKDDETNHLKPLSEMTGDELRQAVASLNTELITRSAKAKLIDGPMVIDEPQGIELFQ